MHACRKVTERRAPPQWFLMAQELHYECLRGPHVSASGTGQTFLISCKGVLFTADHNVKRGDKVRLAIAWPSLQEGARRTQLEIDGFVVVSEPGSVAVRIGRYGFAHTR